MSSATLQPVTMPQLSGGRDRARQLLRPLEAQLRDAVLRLDCHNLVAGTASFADELVERALVEFGAAQLLVEHAGSTFSEYVRQSAADHGVVDRVDFI